MSKIVREVQQMLCAVGERVTINGIETPETLDALERVGCLKELVEQAHGPRGPAGAVPAPDPFEHDYLHR